MRKSFVAIVLFVSILIIAACGQQSTETYLEIDDIPEIEITHTSVIEESDELYFQTIWSVGTTHDGYVLFGVNNTDIHVFDLEGNHVRQLTSEGKGPGEIERVTSIALDENSNLIVTNRSQAVLFTYSGSGDWNLEKTIAGGFTELGFPSDYYPASYPDELLVSIVGLPDESNIPPYFLLYSKINTENEVLVDSITVMSSDNALLAELPFGAVGISAPFGPEDIINVKANGNLIRGNTGSFSFEVFNSDAELLRTFEHQPIQPISVTKEMVQEWANRNSIENTSDFITAAPDYAAYYREMKISNTGRHLLRLHGMHSNQWVLLDEEEGIIGKLTYENPVAIRHFDGERLYKVITTEEGLFQLHIQTLAI